MFSARKVASWAAMVTLASSYHQPASATAVLKAEYLFKNTLASDVPGAPNLIAVDPQAASSFKTDTVFGSTQPVFNFQSSSSASDQQAGLVFSASGGLIAADNYSVQMVFKFTQRDLQWRRLVDSTNRQLDDGLYIDFTNHLNTWPTTVTGPTYTTGDYVNVAVTVSGNNTVDAYMNGTREFSTTNSAMDITSADMLSFFLDNTADGGTGEWSPGDIAALRIYSGILTQDQINSLNNSTASPKFDTPPTGTPEPTALALVASGVVGMMLVRRRQDHTPG